jgi:hypothetical protein
MADEQTIDPVNTSDQQTEMVAYVPNGVNWTLVSPNSVDPGHKHTPTSVSGFSTATPGLTKIAHGTGTVNGSTGFTISGLDINTDREYELTLMISRNVTGAPHDNSVSINFDTSNNYSYCNARIANTNVYDEDSNISSIKLFYDAGANLTNRLFKVYIAKESLNNKVRAHWTGSLDTGPNFSQGVLLIGSGSYNSTTNVTSITIFNSSNLDSYDWYYEYWISKLTQ